MKVGEGPARFATRPTAGGGGRASRPGPGTRGTVPRQGCTFLSTRRRVATSHWTEDLFVGNPGLFAPVLRGKAGQAADGVSDLLAQDETDSLAPGSVVGVGCGIGRHVEAFDGEPPRTGRVGLVAAGVAGPAG